MQQRLCGTPSLPPSIRTTARELQGLEVLVQLAAHRVRRLLAPGGQPAEDGLQANVSELLLAAAELLPGGGVHGGPRPVPRVSF